MTAPVNVRSVDLKELDDNIQVTVAMLQDDTQNIVKALGPDDKVAKAFAIEVDRVVSSAKSLKWRVEQIIRDAVYDAKQVRANGTSK